jgi:hypothetical protein
MFRHRCRIPLGGAAWLLVLLLCTPVSLDAQQLDGLRPGTLVRVTAPTVAADPLVGSVEVATTEVLVVRVRGEPEAVRIPAYAIEELVILAEPRPHPVLRAVGGILTGVAIVLAIVVYGAIAG